jgi:prolyl oligopeptidase
MKKFILPLSIIAMAMQSCSTGPSVVKYPPTAKVNHTDNYFGTQVEDPYRWLENDRSDSTAQWVKQQNEVTFAYLKKIPFREQIRKTLTQIWNYPKEGIPTRYGTRYFVWKNDGLQNQSVLYQMDSLNGETRIFIDPNSLSEDGTTRVGNLSVSNDKKYVAYTQSSGGSDWKEIRLKTMDGEDLPDIIKWVKFSGIAWVQNGFYYSAYDAPKGSALSEQNQFNKVYYHELGTPQGTDILVYEDRKNPLRYNTAGATEDERFLILSVSAGTDGNSLAVKDLRKPNSPFISITPQNFENEYSPIENFGDDILVLTNEGAANYRLMKVNISSGKPKWDVVIPESRDVLTGAQVIGGKIVVEYLHNAYSQMFIYDADGKNREEVALPGIGSVTGISGDKKNSEFFYSFTSFALPPVIFRVENIGSPVPELYKETKLSIQPSQYETKQVWYASKDGTKIPMFVVHKKGIVLEGQNPTLLYGYGGFNISMTPSFSTSNILFLEQGGIYAVACLRGGGEFGKEWHKAGTKLSKQNVFDDFIAAAEYLIAEKYTSPDKLAIRGGSNGGLLVGACMTQRPELFKVALAAVGVMDMLRFHKFTVGWGWVDDYGSSDKEEEFKYIYKYSPLHNIKAGIAYPATLITTADHDDRVVPAHSFKFAATLQAAQAGENPTLIRIETMSGHGSSSTSKAIEELTDMWAFTLWNLGAEFKEIKN